MCNIYYYQNRLGLMYKFMGGPRVPIVIIIIIIITVMNTEKAKGKRTRLGIYSIFTFVYNNNNTYTSMVKKKKVKFDLFLILYTRIIHLLCVCGSCSVVYFLSPETCICVALILNTINIYNIQTRFITRTRTFPGPTPLPRPPHGNHITIIVITINNIT